VKEKRQKEKGTWKLEGKINEKEAKIKPKRVH
jgi:hypothetical protein